MKYKKGDKVLMTSEQYPKNWNREKMDPFKGTTQEIEKALDYCYYFVNKKLTDTGCSWTDDHIEKLVSSGQRLFQTGDVVEITAKYIAPGHSFNIGDIGQIYSNWGPKYDGNFAYNVKVAGSIQVVNENALKLSTKVISGDFKRGDKLVYFQKKEGFYCGFYEGQEVNFSHYADHESCHCMSLDGKTPQLVYNSCLKRVVEKTYRYNQSNMFGMKIQFGGDTIYEIVKASKNADFDLKAVRTGSVYDNHYTLEKLNTYLENSSWTVISLPSQNPCREVPLNDAQTKRYEKYDKYYETHDYDGDDFDDEEEYYEEDEEEFSSTDHSVQITPLVDKKKKKQKEILILPPEPLALVSKPTKTKKDILIF